MSWHGCAALEYTALHKDILGATEGTAFGAACRALRRGAASFAAFAGPAALPLLDGGAFAGPASLPLLLPASRAGLLPLQSFGGFPCGGGMGPICWCICGHQSRPSPPIPATTAPQPLGPEMPSWSCGSDPWRDAYRPMCGVEWCRGTK